jgi:hypothetical protein
LLKPGLWVLTITRQEIGMNANPKKKDGNSDWDQRVLCSDGNCIGVIGPDGRCKECGKPYEGELPFGIEQPDQENQIETEAPENDAPNGADAETSAPDNDLPSESDDPDWENRKLCSDGNCIGVIGPDGKCKECGKPYEGDAE